jgi:adenine-specific DNA-methyltransferase
MSIDKIKTGDDLSQSLNIVSDNISKLKELFPEVLTEGKIDFKVLQDILGNEIEEDEEFYRFTWAGKSQSRREAHKPSTGTLRPCKEESMDWDTTQNLYIEGDNLEVLKLLQKSYSNKIKMIYIDPPYNTGKDFVYKDNYKDNLKNYQQLTGQVDDYGNKLLTNTESDGRYHSNWLNMMYPRLLLAHHLLTDDGVIFISIDDNEQANLKLLMDNVFGESNLVYKLSVVDKLNGNDNSSGMMETQEYCFIYAKNINKFEVGVLPIDEESDEWQIDNLGFWKEGGGIKATGVAARREDRPNLYYPIYINEETLEFSLEMDSKHTFELFPIIDNEDGRWTWQKEKFINDAHEVIIKKVKNGYSVYKKQRPTLGDLPCKRGKTTFYNSSYSTANSSSEIKGLFDGKKVFDFTKSSHLIKDLISLGNTKKDSIILDFFSGSSTTAHSIFKLNIEDIGSRKFIMVQLPEFTSENSEAYRMGYHKLTEIGKERIRRAGRKIKEENSLLSEKLDTGFKVFKLDSSNINGWDGQTDNLENSLFESQDNIKSDRKEEDVLFEILLKYGLDLTLPIQEKVIEGKKVFNVGFGALFICLGNELTSKVAEGIGQWKETLKPETCRVIFKDGGFTDVEKTNSVQTLKRFGIQEIKSI